MLSRKPVEKKERKKLFTLENGIALSFFIYKTLSAVKKLSEGVDVTEAIDEKEVVENEL